MISSTLLFNFSLEIGILPTYSTVIAAIHAASAEDCIKGVLVHTPTARAASKESPAPATSTGLGHSAGKYWRLTNPSSSVA